MNHLLPTPYQLSNPNHLENLEGQWQGATFLFFIKDKNGEYLQANQIKLECFGFQKENEILTLNDFDLSMTEVEAKKLRENDQRVIQLNNPISFVETATIANGEVISTISYKSPLRLGRKVSGVIGVAFILPKILSQLSKKQSECLHFLSQGMTIKEIARKVSLSHRTVEHYLERIKNKFNCNSRSELIKLYLDKH